MANNNLLLLVLGVVVAFVVYYYVYGGQLTGACDWCPTCGKKAAKSGSPTCPSCVVTDAEAMQVLQQMARGCTHRLRGVVREDMASPSDVSEFMTAGTNRLTIITNIDPEDFVNIIQSGHKPTMSQIKAVAISASVVKGKKNYIVMSFANGKMSPIGAPTTKFTSAFKYFESTVRKQVGPDTNNLVFYIDEDVPCPAQPEEEHTQLLPVHPEQPPLSPTVGEACLRGQSIASRDGNTVHVWSCTCPPLAGPKTSLKDASKGCKWEISQTQKINLPPRKESCCGRRH